MRRFHVQELRSPWLWPASGSMMSVLCLDQSKLDNILRTKSKLPEGTPLWKRTGIVPWPA